MKTATYQPHWGFSGVRAAEEIPSKMKLSEERISIKSNLLLFVHYCHHINFYCWWFSALTLAILPIVWKRNVAPFLRDI